MSFDGWLDARDGETLARAWATLGATRTEVGAHSKFVLGIQPHGAAQLAAAWLGCSPERFAWFAMDRLDDEEARTSPAPVFAERRPVTRCFLDGAIDVSEPDCGENWQIREIIDGPRGVQFITVDYSYGPMTREGGNGGSAKVVRLFDRSTSRAVSLQLWSRDVYTIGAPVDLSPLDLFAHRVTYQLPWTEIDLDSVRGFVAQLTADLDAHFDTSAEWGGGVSVDKVLESEQYNFRTRRLEHRFQAGPYAIEFGQNLDPDDPDDEPSMIYAEVRGLPFGHQVNVRVSLAYEHDEHDVPPKWTVDGWIDFTLPLAQLDAAVARAAAVPGIQIT